MKAPAPCAPAPLHLRRQRRRKGFTLIEMMVVVFIISTLVALLLPVLLNARQRARIAAAHIQMHSLMEAMEKYRDDFRAYPPDDTPSTNGSEIFWYYLCRKTKSGDMTYGPYLETPDEKLKGSASGGNKRFVSPLNGDYFYKVLRDAPDKDGYIARRRYIIVDPGSDSNTVEGGITTDSDGNEYFKPGTDSDNIYSSDQAPKPQ